MTNSQKVILILMSLTVLCLCAFFVALTPAVSPTTQRPPIVPTPSLVSAPTATPLLHKKFMAQIKCERFVKEHLVSPSSAKFSNEKSYKINGEPPNYHAVTGIVESQNRMGVLLRSGYRCDTHYLPNDSSVWILDYLDIED